MSAYETTRELATARLRITICGVVQGVGFRPAMYRLATQLGLNGWVQNDAQGVQIEVEGAPDQLSQFLLRLEQAKPARASIQSMEPIYLDPVGYSSFKVRQSRQEGARTAIVLPDLGTCSDCRRELFDPLNRRYRYPFTNCTHCGPRFTIIEDLPYDRAATTMRHFAMCEACQAEYDDPRDRRFHAQPNACPRCGPQLELWDSEGRALARDDEALQQAATALRGGQIVAVKGIGGFHLMVDARNVEAVARLRERKRRDEKPFALLYPSLAQILYDCQVLPLERRLLRSPEAPIVLLRRLDTQRGLAIAANVAPGSAYLGVMLPSNPLHLLLMHELGFPVVATSGNLSEEPICTDEQRVLEQLGGMADLYLVHNRPIARHVDDSIARIILGREQLLRRARGYAPLPILLAEELPDQTLLATGAQLKGAVALAIGHQVFLSQHLGDLENARSFRAFEQVIASFTQLYQATPALVACDQHPDYRSSLYARDYASAHGIPLVQTQHHHAHILACMAEHQLSGPILGAAWDGSGYGPDGSSWGGEFLLVTDAGYERVAALRSFSLPGGDQAAREPRRSAFGLLYELYGAAAFQMEELAPVRACSAQERSIFERMLSQQLNTPRTSSAGRLFDAVAALLDLRQGRQYEGQAAALLEHAATEGRTDRAYPFDLIPKGQLLVVDWEPAIRALLDELRLGVPSTVIAAAFHNTMAVAILAVALQIGEPRVILSGGCFQNAYLLEHTAGLLDKLGFACYWPQHVPTNDGGIALGQIADLVRQTQRATISREG